MTNTEAAELIAKAASETQTAEQIAAMDDHGLAAYMCVLLSRAELIRQEFALISEEMNRRAATQH